LKGLDVIVGTEEDENNNNCTEDTIDIVNKSDNKPQDPDDPIHLNDNIKDFPEAKTFFNYLPGIKLRFTDRYAYTILNLKIQLRDYQLTAV